MAKSFFITTPIYYVNDIPHIGHAYTTVLADVISRYHSLFGYKTFFLTGTDEHGQKVQQAAALRNLPPKQHVDEYSARFKELWSRLNIDYSKFIRTTDSEHISFVRERLQQLFDQGDIYTKLYAGWYSISEERFFSEDELVDGRDPVSGKPVEWIEEKNYFFRMSRYKEKLLEHIESRPGFISPAFRRNEVLGFLKKELNDLCISRPKSRLSWGVTLPFDQDYVTYVWFDALLNYASAVSGETPPIWPPTLQVIGKDILTTHTVYWTTMLIALERPLPEHILAHGWWLNKGAKMSKSSGTAIDPVPYIEKFGVDAFRYFLISSMTVGQDASFTDTGFIKRLNSDLANDLGNCVNRVYKQIQNNFEGSIPVAVTWDEADEDLKMAAEKVIESVIQQVKTAHLSLAVEKILSLVRHVNKYIDEKAPWRLAREPDKRDELSTVLFVSAEALRISLTLLYPVMPEKCSEGLAVFGLDSCSCDSLKWGVLKGGESINPSGALFPRIDTRKTSDVKKKQDKDPLSLLELRVAEIVEAVPHPDAESLFALKVSTGNETRSVCAGLRGSYSAEELVKKRVVLLANLKPAKLRGVESRGMLLAGGGEDGRPELIDPGSISPGEMLQFGEIVPEPKTNLTSKDFGKVRIEVKDKFVVSGGHHLHFKGEKVICASCDGAVVR